jgi:phage-related minor tail protein
MAEKAEIVLTATDATGPAFATAKKNVEALGKSVGATGIQHQIAAVQVKDFFEQIVSGGSPVRAFAQQGAAVVSTYGGFTNTLKALGGLLSPAILLIGTAAAGVGILAAAFIGGSKESRAFSDAVKLSGNYAGQTAGQFDAAAKSIADSSKVTISAAKDFGRALLSTGEVGPQNFRVATEAAARYGEATGKTADEVAKDFAAMGADAAKWAADHNRALHFITAAQYEQIKALQDSGRAGQAQAVVYDALNQHLHTLDNNLGYIDRGLAAASKGWDSFWNAAKGVGKVDTVEEELAKLDQQIGRFSAGRQKPVAGDSTAAKVAIGIQQKTLGDLGEKQSQALRRLMRESENAFGDALRADTQKEGIAARTRLDALIEETKNATALSKALQQNQIDFKKAADAGVGLSPEKQKTVDDATRKKFAATAGTAARSKELDGYLKNLQDGLEKEHDLYQFASGRLDELFSHGDLSIQAYYAAKKAAADDDLKNQTDTFDAEIAALRKHQAELSQQPKGEAPLDPAALAAANIDDENKINVLIDARAKAIREAGQAAVVAGVQSTRAVEALNNALSEFDASLADLGGDKYSADLKRNALRLEEARKLLAGEPGGDPARLDALRQALQLQADANKAQADGARETESLQRAEELFNIKAAREGLDRTDTERGLLAIRNDQITSLERQIDTYAELIRVSKLANKGIADPALITFYENLKLAREKAFDAKDPGFVRFTQLATQAGDAIANSFENAVFVSGKLSDKFHALVKDLARLVVHDAVTQPLANTITSGLKGIGQDGKGGGSETLLSGIAANVWHQFGGPATPSSLSKLTSGSRFDLSPTAAASASPAAVADAAGLSAPIASALDVATTALGVFTQALGTAASAVPATPGGIPTGAGAIGLPGAATSGAAIDGGTNLFAGQSPAATAAAGDAIAKLSDSASTGADKVGSSTTALVQSVNLAGSAMGGLPGVITQLIASLLALTASTTANSSTNFFSKLAGLFGSGGGTAGGGGGFKTGGAAAGGPMRAGEMSQVNELGPELLVIDGKQVLMMGSKPGHIVPHDKVAAALAGSDRVQIMQAHAPGTPGAGLDSIDGARFARFLAALTGNHVSAPRLAPNEVAAILMGGPKGQREEVLHADDPRHRDNLRYHTGGLVGQSANAAAPSDAWRQREGGGGSVYITNNTPATVSASKDDNGDWRVLVDAAAKQAHAMVAADHASGSGPSSAALRRRGVNLDANNPRRQ